MKGFRALGSVLRIFSSYISGYGILVDFSGCAIQSVIVVPYERRKRLILSEWLSEYIRTNVLTKQNDCPFHVAMVDAITVSKVQD